MTPLESPIPHLVEASQAAAKIVSLQADLFVLNQELKTIRQMKRLLWVGNTVILLNLLMTLSFYWVGVSLHERGWSALSLAFTSVLFFGFLASVSAGFAIYAGRKPKEEQET